MAWSQGTTARWAALAIANLWCRRDTPLLVGTIKGPAFTQRTPCELLSCLAWLGLDDARRIRIRAG